MSKEELLKITRQQSSELKALHKRVKRLEECRKKMSDVGEKKDADFRFIFERLEKGVREKNRGTQRQFSGKYLFGSRFEN